MRNLVIITLVYVSLAAAVALAEEPKPKPAAAAAPVASAPAKTASKSATVAGRVIGPDGKPIAGATVRLLSAAATKEPARPRGKRPDPSNPSLAVSGADGAFKFDGLEGASFLVRIEAKGFAPAFADKVPAGASLSLKLKPGLPVVGRVLDLTTQKPVAGARVGALEHDAEAFGRDAAHAATTADDGTFSIADCAPGVVVLDAIAPAHARARLENVVVRPLRQDEAPKPEANTLYLRPGGRLAGRVVGSDGKPVQDAVVLATASEGAIFAMMREAPPAVRTDASGRFDFDGLVAGNRWTIHARKAGLADGEAAPVAVEGSTDRSDLEIKLESGATLTFRLLTADDLPVTDLDVSLRPGGAQGGAGARRGRAFGGPNGQDVGPDQIVPGADGKVTVKNLEPALVDVTVSPTDYADVTREAVRLKSGETVDLGTLRVKEAKSIAGRVSDATGQPVVGATVSSFWFDGGNPHSRETHTKADGHYRLSGLGTEPVRDLSVNADGFASGHREGATPGDNAVDFTLDRLGSVAGKVLLPDGTPPPAVRVQAHAEAKEGQERAGFRVVVGMGRGEADETFSDPAGNFRLDNVTPGKVTIEVHAQGMAPGRKTGIDVRADQVADAGTITLESGRALRGRVLAGKDDAPVPGASITLSQPQGFVMRIGADAADGFAVSGIDGTFEIAGLEPRAYAVAASQPDYSPSSGRVEIPADQDVSDFIIRLSKGGILTGTVHDAQKQPVPGVQILIAKMPMSGGPQTATTAADGRYSIDKLPPGDYIVLKAPAPGQPLMLSSGMKQASIREGETTVFDLDDASKINLSGRVLRAGQPVANAMLMFSAGTLEGGTPVDMKTTRSDDTGRYQVGLDTPGPYAVVVSTGGFMAHGAAGIPVTVPDQPNPVVDIQAKAAGISGRVTGPDGKPVTNAFVSATFLGTGAPPRPYQDGTDPDGSYRIEGIEPGSYRVNVAAPGLRNGEVTGVAVTADTETPGIDFHLDSARTIHGHLVDAGGRGIAGAMVFAAAAGTVPAGRESLPANTDVNGAFVLTAPVDGPLDLAGVSAGCAVARASGINPADDLDAVLTVPRGGRLKITALGGDGKPVAGAAVICRAVPAFLGSDMAGFMNRPPATGADGVSLAGPLAPGSYDCTVTASKKTASQAVTVGDGSETAVSVVIP
jgi:protocatechuate 3,4-dioxygenase beta subunit